VQAGADAGQHGRDMHCQLAGSPVVFPVPQAMPCTDVDSPTATLPITFSRPRDGPVVGTSADEKPNRQLA
jgi:hypothetical protein